MKAVLIIIIVFSFLPPLSKADDMNSWTSKDGRVLEAKGISWNLDGINLVRIADGKNINIPYQMLGKDDVVKALEKLPFIVNDNIRIRARSIKVNTSNLKRDSGNYIAVVDLITYDGSGIASIRPIQEKYKVSGRDVEVDMSSINGTGYAGLEFYALSKRDNSASVYYSECSVVKFEQFGSKHIFSSAPVENYTGWVVIARSLNTGRIIGIQSSMRHLENIVTSNLPEVANFSRNTDKMKKHIISLLD